MSLHPLPINSAWNMFPLRADYECEKQMLVKIKVLFGSGIQMQMEFVKKKKCK